ncbi:MAG: hypothetical protein GY797_14460 [Deltaproteobacteria bacterium]|nr:hypothetical protein [Deltaproteobacteria bacterium]
MKYITKYIYVILIIISMIPFLTGCGPRLSIITGTDVGLSANSGDGTSRPPQVTLGYKRGEMAIISTARDVAKNNGTPGSGTVNTDAFSSLATFHLKTRWFDETKIKQFIATGHASTEIQEGDEFAQGFAQATIGVVPEAIQNRKQALANKLGALVMQDPANAENQAKEILNLAGYRVVGNKTAVETLQDYILHANNDPKLTKLEAAFGRLSI